MLNILTKKRSKGISEQEKDLGVSFLSYKAFFGSLALWLLWCFGHSHSSLAFLFCKLVLPNEAVAQGCSTTSMYFGDLNVRLLSLVRIEAIFSICRNIFSSCHCLVYFSLACQRLW